MNQYKVLSVDATSPQPEPELDNSVGRTMTRIRELHDELNQALYAHPTERPIITSQHGIAEILGCFLTGLDHEEFWVVTLDTRNRISKIVRLYVGAVGHLQIRTPEIFRQAIIDNNPRIILGHNHPSGDPAPSPEDISTTKELVQAGDILEIEVLDHIIIGENGKFVSLKEKGLGFNQV